MSIADIKHTLRKLDFPQSAREALVKIEQILSTRNGPTSKQLDIVMDVISEFVFCEMDRRGQRRNAGLNPLQELQLIDVICDYLSGPISEITKNTIFLSLFGGAESHRRAKILGILASMAVSASSTPMLLAVGVWLQQMGCSSPQSLQLVENVIRDHFYLNTSNQLALKSLAKTAPQFVANFITAVTELYMRDSQGNVKLPPKNLLEVITSWVYSNPGLCAASPPPAPLPPGAIPMAAGAPLAGLLAWCALAPLHITDHDTEMKEAPSPPKKIKLEGEDHFIALQAPTKPLTEAELYSKLHLGVLNSLRSSRRTSGTAAVSAQQLAALAPAVLATSAAAAPHRMQDCLDRLGQAVQVALASGCVYGNIGHLLAALDTLPENRLLKIIIRTHRQTM